MRKLFLIIVAGGFFVLGVGVWTQRDLFLGRVREESYRVPLPSAQPFLEARDSSGADSLLVPSPGVAPGESLAAPVNLAVPFAPQAPFANWDQPYQDACEEAAVIMVEHYLRGADLTLETMDSEILRMVAFEREQYGLSHDSNTAETARLAEDFYPGLTARVAYGVDAAALRAELVQGRPVIVLANGRLLGNPFYTQPGPEKHALVIKGFSGDRFVTNDPGTKRGADFVYDSATLLGALVDYDGGTPGTGERAMIVLEPGS